MKESPSPSTVTQNVGLEHDNAWRCCAPGNAAAGAHTGPYAVPLPTAVSFPPGTAMHNDVLGHDTTVCAAVVAAPGTKALPAAQRPAMNVYTRPVPSMTTQKSLEAHDTPSRFRPATVATGADHGAATPPRDGDAVVAGVAPPGAVVAGAAPGLGALGPHAAPSRAPPSTTASALDHPGPGPAARTSDLRPVPSCLTASS